MEDKVQNGDVPRQPDVALPWDAQAHRLDTIQRLQAAQEGIAKAISALTDPHTSERDVASATEWGDRIWAAAKGHGLPHLARMFFLECLTEAATDVRAERETLPELALQVFSNCALHGWTQYWGKLWVERESGEIQALLQTVIQAWADGSQRRGEGNVAIRELLQRAGIGVQNVKHLLKQWQRWREKEPDGQRVASLYPHDKGARPMAAATAARTKKPGPKPTRIAFPAEQAARMVDREKHIEEMAENLTTSLRGAPKKDVLVKMLKKHDRNL